MGFLDKIFGSKKDDEEEELEEVLKEALDEQDVITPPAKMYVKKIDLRNEGDVKLILKELKDGNLVIVNVLPMKGRPKTLNRALSKLKKFTADANGDIARVSEHLVLVTPEGVKIVKKKK